MLILVVWAGQAGRQVPVRGERVHLLGGRVLGQPRHHPPSARLPHLQQQDTGVNLNHRSVVGGGAFEGCLVLLLSSYINVGLTDGLLNRLKDLRLKI